MIRLNLFFTFTLSILVLTSSQANETDYLSIYSKLISNNLKLSNIDKENAEFKIEKKEESFDYALKYKLSKYSYGDSYLDYSTSDFYNEDLYSFLFVSRIYLDDKIWLNINMNHTDSSKSIIDNTGNLAYKKRSLKEKSVLRLFYKPNSFITSNISYENINSNIDYDKFTNQTYKNANNKKFSFNITTDFNFFTIDSSFYQVVKDNNYFVKNENSDDYLKTSEELYRGVELSISKDIIEDLNLKLTGKLTNMEIVDSNLENTIGKEPTYIPSEEIDLKIEYLYKDVKFMSKINHVSSRYSDSLNTDKLDSYTLASVGASFFTKLNDENVKVDLNVRNILNKDYYLYSGNSGQSTNYFVNLTMRF